MQLTIVFLGIIMSSNGSDNQDPTKSNEAQNDLGKKVKTKCEKKNFKNLDIFHYIWNFLYQISTWLMEEIYSHLCRLSNNLINKLFRYYIDISLHRLH